MQLLVTGGDGSLSQRLIQRFTDAGHRQWVVGARNLAQNRVQYIRETSLRSIDFATIDAIVHLDGPAPSQSISSRQQQVYLSQTLDLLQRANRAAVPKIIFVGSIAHSRSKHPFLRLKLEQEKAIKESNIPYIIFKAPWIVGPSDNLLSPLAQLVRNGSRPDNQAIADKPLQWITQDELADAIIHWLPRRVDVSRAYNVASCEPMSWFELCNQMIEHFGTSPKKLAALPYGETLLQLINSPVIGTPTAFRIDFGRPMQQAPVSLRQILTQI